MKNRVPGEWIAAATMAAVLIVPCVAAAGQDFAPGSQQARERFENAYAQGQNAIERAQWQRAI